MVALMIFRYQTAALPPYLLPQLHPAAQLFYTMNPSLPTAEGFTIPTITSNRSTLRNPE